MTKKPNDCESNSGPEKRNCFQCRVLLDEDESFCIACGASNPTETLERRLDVEMKVEKRVAELRHRRRFGDSWSDDD